MYYYLTTPLPIKRREEPDRVRAIDLVNESTERGVDLVEFLFPPLMSLVVCPSAIEQQFPLMNAASVTL